MPSSVFRVPLTWFISETKVSMYIKTAYLEESMLLFKNITKRFGARHGDLRQLDSRVIRLDYDHYASIDIQAYSCYPKTQVKMNPL